MQLAAESPETMPLTSKKKIATAPPNGFTLLAFT